METNSETDVTRSGSVQPDVYVVGDSAINHHTSRICKILQADADGGCVLDTKHGPLYHSATLMEEHWKLYNEEVSEGGTRDSMP